MRKMCLLFICYITLVILISGCAEKGPDVEQIKSDLSNTDFTIVEELNDLYGGYPVPTQGEDDEAPKMSITDIKVDKVIHDGDEYEILCTVLQENDDYRKESDTKLVYLKSETWQYCSYNKIDKGTISAISFVPEQCINASGISPDGIMYDNGNGWNLSYGVGHYNIEHNFDAEEMKDIINVRYTFYGPACDVSTDVEAEFKFDKKWTAISSTSKTVDREWHIDKICGKTWQNEQNAALNRMFRINSVDTENQTVNISYGETSLTYDEIRNYSIINFQHDTGEAEEMIVISLSNDYYDIELREDDIIYGGVMVPLGCVGKKIF